MEVVMDTLRGALLVFAGELADGGRCETRQTDEGEESESNEARSTSSLHLHSPCVDARPMSKLRPVCFQPECSNDPLMLYETQSRPWTYTII
jgi:hypothetical protein